MKCIYCQSDTKGKERKSNGGRCAKCHHLFAFEPTLDANRTTDGLFQSAINQVSTGGMQKFTEKQLWYEYNRKLLRRLPNASPYLVGAILSVFGGFASVAFGGFIAGVGGILVGCGLAVAGLVYSIKQIKKDNATRLDVVRVPADQFLDRCLHKWVTVHGPIKGLISGAPSDEPLPTSSLPPDVTHYSFDRALVTQHRDVAEMLVANRFHFENNCAVLSLDGYPELRHTTIMQMLSRNEKLTVFALHDASIAGCELPGKLREARWFPQESVRIVDLGLRPSHVHKGGMLARKQDTTTLHGAIRKQLTTEEIDWLQRGMIVELECLRPAKLMRAIYQGFARDTKAMSQPAGNGGVYVDNGYSVWVYDSGVDIHAADSFG